MKKIFLMMTFVLLIFAVTEVIVPNEAQAAMTIAPLECSTAAEMGWRNPGWNTLCIWALQMDAWCEDNLDWWAQLAPNVQDKDAIDAINKAREPEIYAIKSDGLQTMAWFPLRT